MRDDYETLLLERPGPHLLLITLNRPEAANAMNTQMGRDFLDLYRSLMLEVGDLRCVVVTGAGERAFCAGGDLKERNNMTDDEWQAQHVIFEQAMYTWMDCPLPVIAAVNGWAMGVGFWYAMACDITIASERAVFAQPEVHHISNTTFLFAALAGWKAAHRYGLTGDHMDAREAHRIGIVNEVVPADDLMPTARALAERIAKVPEPSVRLNKAITCYGLEAAGLRGGMLLNGALSTLAHASNLAMRDDLLATMQSDGMRAFLDKRDGPFRPEPFGPKSKVD